MQTLRQQTVVMVTGPAGAGKSTIAVVLARALPAVLIDNDVKPGTIDPLLAGEARREARAAAYDALTDAALDAARSGAHVVVAAPLSEERRDARAWDHLCDRFADAGAQAVLAWIRVPAGDLLERLAARSADRDEVKLANPEAWLREADPGTPPDAAHIEIDGKLPAEEAAGALLAALYGGRPVTEREACSS